MIAVIDYKAGNLTSVVKALRYLGADDIVVTQEPSDVRRAKKIVLPGVGHFQSTQLLHDLGLTEATRAAVAEGTPFLGICVGLQWLYEGSTEAPETRGLRPVCGSLRALPCAVRRRGVEVAACGLELARERSARLASCWRALSRAASCTTRTRGARRCRTTLPRRTLLRWRVHGRCRARQRHGCAVPSREVCGHRPARAEELPRAVASNLRRSDMSTSSIEQLQWTSGRHHHGTL